MGYRLNLGTVALDLTGGVEASYLYFGRVTGRATTDEGETYRVQRKYGTASLDARSRFQLTATRNGRLS